jgi:hypothetical protein
MILIDQLYSLLEACLHSFLAQLKPFNNISDVNSPPYHISSRFFSLEK